MGFIKVLIHIIVLIFSVFSGFLQVIVRVSTISVYYLIFHNKNMLHLIHL